MREGYPSRKGVKIMISSNRYLTIEEMTENAQYILDWLVGKGWTKEAACAVLGNMQSESTMNPGLWENTDEGNFSVGFGLVQWTPASKYIDWAENNGLEYMDIDSQLQRILYEVETKIQWYYSGMSFQQFTQSTDQPGNLANLFLMYYERPKNQVQPWRAKQAEYWYNTLNVTEVNKMDEMDGKKLVAILKQMYRMGITKIDDENGNVFDTNQDDIHRLADVVRDLAGLDGE